MTSDAKPNAATVLNSARTTSSDSEAPWAQLIPEEHWMIFCAAGDAMHKARVQFLLGGALALATHTGRWRNTKDVDVLVRAHDRDPAVAAIATVGFVDYFDTEPYDRSWIYRGMRDGMIFDIIWDLPNHRVKVDEAWFERARRVHLHGRIYDAVSPEELIRIKLYVLQRERCDWVDVLNILAATAETIDWDWLVARMGRDLGLLHGATAVFNWMCPGVARRIPEKIRRQFALSEIDAADSEATEQRRVSLLDSRPWFAMHQPLDRPLER